MVGQPMTTYLMCRLLIDESLSPLLFTEEEVIDEITSQVADEKSVDILPPMSSLATPPDIPSKDLPRNDLSLSDRSEHKRNFLKVSSNRWSVNSNTLFF